MTGKNKHPSGDGAYEGLARRYRPQTFADVVGQKHVVTTLSKAIQARRWSHAYLFIGGRGLGKTTMARLVAKCINCENGPTLTPCGTCSHCEEIAAGRHIDVLEIDAASNTGVDNVRDSIIQAVATAPARANAKIFIIDEVHMLSGGAFNALLKTIEEPPPHVIFILATTDGHKVPSTIRSRCQRFDFRPVPADLLAAHLLAIARKEHVKVEEGALRLICEHAEGGVRDALSALDLARSFAEDAVTTETAEEALGVIPSTTIRSLMQTIQAGATSEAEKSLADMIGRGADPSEVLRGLTNAFRRALLDDVEGRSANLGRGRIVRSLEAILAVADRYRYSRHPILELEVLLCRLCHLAEHEVTLKELYDRVLEMEISGGIPVRTAEAVVPRATTAPTVSAKGKVGADSTESSLDRERFLGELTAASVIAHAMVHECSIESPSPGILKLGFHSPILFERYRKEAKVQVAVTKAAETVLGGRVEVKAEMAGEGAVETKRNEAPGKPMSEPGDMPRDRTPKSPSPSSKAKETDPEIERLKKLFNADVVEVVDED